MQQDKLDKLHDVTGSAEEGKVSATPDATIATSDKPAKVKKAATSPAVEAQSDLLTQEPAAAEAA
ncbi:hypothetical protein ACFS07_33100 [Undibacterium arcticum]